MVNYGRNADKRKELKKQIEENLSIKINDFVRRTQEEFKGEPFGWSLLARRKFQTLPEYENFDWMKSYPSMEVDVKVDVRFGEFGKQGEVPHLEGVRD
jgi:spore germination protein KC